MSRFKTGVAHAAQPVAQTIPVEDLAVDTVGGGVELRRAPAPRGTEDDVTPIGGRMVLALIPFGRMTELRLTPVSKEIEGDVTPIFGRVVPELTPGPRGIEPKGIAPVPRGTKGLRAGETVTPFLVLGNGGMTELEEGGIVMP